MNTKLSIPSIFILSYLIAFEIVGSPWTENLAYADTPTSQFTSLPPAAQSGGGGSSPAPGPSATQSTSPLNADCTAVCDLFYSNEARIHSACDGQDGSKTFDADTIDDHNNPIAQRRTCADWLSMGQGSYCIANKMARRAHDAALKEVITLSVAFGICLTWTIILIASQGEPTGILKTVAAALQVACTIANVAALAMEIGDIVVLGREGTNDTKSITQELGLSSSSLVGDAVATGTLVLTAASKKVAEKLGSRAGAFIATTACGIALGFKVGAYVSAQKTADSACNNIRDLGGENVITLSDLHYGGAGASATGTSRQATSSSTNSSNSNSNGGTPSGGSSTTPTGTGDLLTSTGAATSSILDQMTPEDRKLVEDKHLNPALIADAALKGGGLAAMASSGGLGDTALPSEVSEMLEKVDQLNKEGRLQMIGTDGSVATLSGGGGGARKVASGGSDPKTGFMAFGKGAAGSTALKEMAFGGKKLVLDDPKEGDIWHEGYKGTIFQIVSFRVNKTGDRVEKLEWVSPLNRALQGLAKNPTQSSPIKILGK